MLPLSKRRALERLTGMRSQWRVTITEPTLAGAIVLDSPAADPIDALIDARDNFHRRTNRTLAQAEIRIAPVHREGQEIEGVPT